MRKKIRAALLLSALCGHSPLFAQVTDMTEPGLSGSVGVEAGLPVITLEAEPRPAIQEMTEPSTADEIAPSPGPGPIEGSGEPTTDVVLGGEGLVPFRCPIEQIRTAYQNLVNPDDTLMALAIEKQTLAICRQSQEALIQIAENEMRLRELFGPIMAPPPELLPDAPIAQIVAPEPARNVTETLPIDPSIAVLPSEEEGSAPIPAAEEQEAPFTTDLVLGAIMRDPDGWKTILVRGEQMFTLREGEEVDETVRVVRIGPTSVTIADPDGNEIVLE